MRTKAQNWCCRIFSRLVEIRQFKRSGRDGPNETRIQVGAQPPMIARSQREQPQGAILSQSQFLNRQALHLRPDPARVVVRPFKPATEPRDLNPTDKTRANHIVDRVLATGARGCRAATDRSAGEFRRSSQEPARDLRDARRRDGRGVGAACRIEQDATLPDRSIFSARVLVRGFGLVQSEHRPAPRPVRCTGKWLSVHPEPSCRRRRAHLIADVPVGYDRRRRQRRRRSDRASRVGPQDRQPDVEIQRRRYRGDFPARRRLERTRHLSGHRRPSQRHRGRPLRRIRRRRTNNVLRDLHGLQRQGDPLRAARNDRFQIVPNDPTLPDRRRATKAWLCFRARSMAAMR